MPTATHVNTASLRTRLPTRQTFFRERGAAPPRSAGAGGGRSHGESSSRAECEDRGCNSLRISGPRGLDPRGGLEVRLINIKNAKRNLSAVLMSHIISAPFSNQGIYDPDQGAMTSNEVRLINVKNGIQRERMKIKQDRLVEPLVGHCPLCVPIVRIVRTLDIYQAEAFGA